MTLLVALVGAGIGVGLLLIVDGLRPRSSSAGEEQPDRQRIDLRRCGLALAGGVPLLVLTRWPIAGLAGAALGWFGRELFGARAAQEHAIARTEAIATWTEMLRDTLSGAHGLEEAITTTAEMAPGPIYAEVTALAVRLQRRPLQSALQDLGEDLAHPIGDLVVAALSLAAQGASGDLRELLGTLAVAARDEASMRLRIEATRARLRTAVRVIAMCTGATALGLVLLNRSYLDAYEDPLGQVVLAGVLGAWGIALCWLSRMGDYVSPERFLAVADTRSPAA